MDFQQIIANDQKLRIVEENVPGKQITLAHVIANPDGSLYDCMGFDAARRQNAMGIVTLSPAEAAIIAADIAIKTGGVSLENVDRTTGTLLVTGTVSQVEAALAALVDYAEHKLGFVVCKVTKT